MTRSQMIESLVLYAQKQIELAIAEGEDSCSFDLPGARMYYEDLSDFALCCELEAITEENV